MIQEGFYMLGRGKHVGYRHAGEHACIVSVIGKVRDGGAQCGLVKEKRYMPEDGHLFTISL